MTYLSSFVRNILFLLPFFSSLMCQENKRYNLVLIPQSEEVKVFESLSQQHFSHISSGYLLGQSSIPHITLCQFECKESKAITILNNFHEVFQEESCTPEFSGLSLIRLAGQFDGLQAAELSVTRSDDLIRLHEKAVTFITRHGLTALNASGDLYRPHLTLSFFSPTKAKLTSIPLTLPNEIFLNRKFIVAIGSSDLNWQLNNIIVECHEPAIQYFLKRTYQYSQEKVAKFYETQEKMDVVLNAFLNGEVFSKQPYTQEEKITIFFNLDHIIREQFREETYSSSPSYISTAGAPGVGKSFFIEQLHGSHPPHAIYTDPDRVCLTGLSCYQNDRKIHGDDYAYTKWRDASNFMANFLLVKACAESRNIIHGTTASSPRIIPIYKYLKEIGYNIQIELLLATAEQRAAALEHRSQHMIQVTQEDAKGKSKPIFSRLHDAYFPYADTLNIYFQTGEFWQGSGELLKYAEFTQNNRALTVINSLAAEKFNQEMASELSEEEAKEYHSKFENSGINIVK